MKKKPGLVVAIGLAKPKGSPPPLPGKGAKPAASPDADEDEPDADDAGDASNTGDSDADDSSPDIDQTQIQGEPGTGYEGPEGGPFACHNCNYFDGGSSSCGQSTMMKKSQLPRTAGGRPQVDPNGCCEYVDRQNGAAPGGAQLQQEQGLKPRSGSPPPFPGALPQAA